MTYHIITDASYNIISADFDLPEAFSRSAEGHHLSSIILKNPWSAYQHVAFNSSPTSYSIDDTAILILKESIHIKTAEFKKISSTSFSGWLICFDVREEAYCLIESVFNTVNDFLFILSQDGSVLKTNNVILQKLQYTETEIKEKQFIFFFPPDYWNEVLNHISVKEHNKPIKFHAPLMKQNGAEIAVETTVTRTFWNRNEVLLCVSRESFKYTNHTGGNQLDDEIFMTLFYNSKQARLLADVQNQVIPEANKKFFSLLHKINIQNTNDFLSMIGLTGSDSDNPFFQQLSETGIASKTHHFSNLTETTKEHHIKLTAELVAARNEKYILITAEDVTNEHESNTGILENIDRMNLILESSGSGLWDWDIPSGTVKVNKQFSLMLGHKKLNDNETASFFLEKIHPDDKAALEDMFTHFMRRKLSSGTAEFRMKHRCGEWIWLQGKGKIVARSADGNPLRITGINTVIQQKKLQEAKLIYHQKFEALLLNITLSFINIEPSETDNGICESLTRVSEFINAYYACTALLNQKGDYIQITHTGVMPIDIKNKNEFCNKAFRFDDGWVDTILNNKITNISASTTLQTIPKIFMLLMQEVKIKSLAVIPIINNQKLFGILIFGFENSEASTHKLSEPHFTTFANIILKVLQQKETKNKKLENQQFSEMKVKVLTKELKNLNKKLHHEIEELSIRNTDLQKFEILADQNDSALLITDLNLDTVFTNFRFSALFGKKMQALQLFSELAENPDKREKILMRLSRQEGIANQLTYLKSKNSVLQPFMINAKSLKNDHKLPVYFAFTISDLQL